MRWDVPFIEGVGAVSKRFNYDDNDASEQSLFNWLDSSAMRVALLFGSAAVAVALILTPIIDRGAGSVMANRAVSAELDKIATGSVNDARVYTIRRSVLQSSPADICVISQDGRERGAC